MKGFKKVGNSTTWRSFTVVSALVAVVFGSAIGITKQWESTLNAALGTSSSKLVETDASSVEDTETYKSSYDNFDDMYSNAKAVAENIEGEGAVLLKNNNNTLPLDIGSKVSCFSRNSVDIEYGSTGLAEVDTSVAPTLRSALEDGEHFEVNPTLWEMYENYTEETGASRKQGFFYMGGITYSTAETPMSYYSADVKSSYSAYNDVAIVTISRSGGEGADLPTGEFTDGNNYLALQDSEKAMLSEIESNFDKVVVLINSGWAMQLDWLEDYNIDAAMWIGTPGQRGLASIDDLLLGNINPSGRLSDTYASDALSAPATQNAGDFSFNNAEEITSDTTKTGANNYVSYSEDIYVGYKYYETRYEDCVLNQGNANSDAGIYSTVGNSWNYADEITFPFGYGQSYTTFSEHLDNVNVGDETISAEITVKNTGEVAGKHAVELFAQSPYTNYDIENNIEKSGIQLLGYGKTNLLAAGATETVTVEMDKFDLASYDADGEGTYILDEGTYYLTVGSDAHDALNNILSKKGADNLVDQDGETAVGNASNVYQFAQSFDNKTFASSNGQLIQNEFDKANLNYYMEDEITFLSRNDWDGTFPTPVTDLTATEEMLNDMGNTYEVGSTDTSEFITEADTNYSLAMMKGADYDDPNWDLIINQMSLDDLASNVGQQGRIPIESISLPESLAKDSPSGFATLYYTDHGADSENPVACMVYPSNIVIGSSWSHEVATAMGNAIGEDSLWNGCAGWYGPAANIHRTAYSGRNLEYYSEDAILSSYPAAEEIEAAQVKGVICYVKHVTLNDQEQNRIGLCVFANEQTIRETYLRTFRRAVTESGTKGIMGSFTRFGCIWTGHNSNFITDVLRGEWNFTGNMTTDFGMSTYMLPTMALEAGTTMFCTSATSFKDAIIEAAPTDAKLFANLREAAHRNLYNLCNSNVMNGVSSTTQIIRVTPWYQKLVIALTIVGSASLLACIYFDMGHILAKLENEKGAEKKETEND